MIRINLSGAPRPKKGKRGGSVAVPSMAGDGPNPVMVMVVLAIVGLAGNGYYYMRLSNQTKQIAVDKQKAMDENRRLAAVKAKYDEAEKQKEVFRKRVDVIDKLRKAQSGPVDLLNTIGTTVNATDQVWLATMRDDGRNISLDGTALSANAVAKLITNLKQTGYFKNVEIRETFQSPASQEMTMFSFSIVCEKADQKS
jgi:type IV pilus assembly protein PilN